MCWMLCSRVFVLGNESLLVNGVGGKAERVNGNEDQCWRMGLISELEWEWDSRKAVIMLIWDVEWLPGLLHRRCTSSIWGYAHTLWVKLNCHKWRACFVSACRMHSFERKRGFRPSLTQASKFRDGRILYREIQEKGTGFTNFNNNSLNFPILDLVRYLTNSFHQINVGMQSPMELY